MWSAAKFQSQKLSKELREIDLLFGKSRMKYINFTTVVLVCFAAYILYTTYTIYTLFKPPYCKGGTRKCIEPYFDERKPLLKQKFTVSIFTSTSKASSTGNMMTMWRKDDFNVMEATSIHVNVSIPKTTRRNGSLFVHIYLHPQGSQPFQNNLASYNTAPLTKYALNKEISFNLLSEKPERNAGSTSGPGSHDIPVTHWRPRLTFHVLTDPVSFSRYAIPSDIYSMLSLSPDGKYIPFLYIDELEMLERNLKPINANTTEMALNIAYSPIGIGKLRVWRNIHASMDSMKDLGFKDNDLDEVKGIFTDTNLYLVGLTFTISIFHLMFDFLAFKSEITYWKKRSTTIGLSTRAVLWRCVSTAIIFLYLLDEKTSLLVLIPTGIGVLIEIWKVTKAFKITLSWSGRLPSLQFGQKSNEEKETEEFDTQAMKYLSYPLYPLLIFGAIYSLLYQPHHSWYSWAIKSAVNGVYVFGFLFMLPQLFVNYKLKSVAHLPWRALMYKAFNTFIDDVFAFIITMPTAHRLACFRDDVVFVIYLYQRWLYPVDVKRVNEYGVSFDNTTKKQHKE